MVETAQQKSKAEPCRKIHDSERGQVAACVLHERLTNRLVDIPGSQLGTGEVPQSVAQETLFAVMKSHARRTRVFSDEDQIARSALHHQEILASLVGAEIAIDTYRSVECLDVLGSGNFGVVYLTRLRDSRVGIDTICAMKASVPFSFKRAVDQDDAVSQEIIAKVKNEVAVLKELQRYRNEYQEDAVEYFPEYYGDAIVYASGSSEEAISLVFEEYRPGVSVHEFLRTQAAQDPGALVRLALELTEALRVLKDRNVYHLDLEKGDNVLVDLEELSLSLIDFEKAARPGEDFRAEPRSSIDVDGCIRKLQSCLADLFREFGSILQRGDELDTLVQDVFFDLSFLLMHGHADQTVPIFPLEHVEAILGDFGFSLHRNSSRSNEAGPDQRCVQTLDELKTYAELYAAGAELPHQMNAREDRACSEEDSGPFLSWDTFEF